MKRFDALPAPLNVVFLTDFSEQCFRSIPSIAQMADDLQMRLTLLHAYNSNKTSHAAAEATLRSFFPEADQYPNTRRVAMPGSAFEVLKRATEEQQVDLLICPGTDRLGLPRPGHRSLRGRILRDLGVPVWTIGHRTDAKRLARRVQNVACWVEFDDDSLLHLSFAAEYARTVEARLHLFYSLPDIHEGMILPPLPERPLNSSMVTPYFRRVLGDLPIEPAIHVTTERSGRARARLAKKHDADLLFTAAFVSPLAPWMFAGLSAINQCHCPTVCVASKSGRIWDLRPGPAFVHSALLGAPAPRAVVREMPALTVARP